MFYLFIFPPECNVENFRRNKESLVEGWCVRFHSYLPWSTYFLNKLPLVGFGWNIVVVLSVFLAQSYTFFTEYLGCILSGGTGKNGSTIAVSEPGKSSLLAYVLSTFFRVWLALALLRNPHIYLVMDAKHRLFCHANNRLISALSCLSELMSTLTFSTLFHRGTRNIQTVLLVAGPYLSCLCLCDLSCRWSSWAGWIALASCCLEPWPLPSTPLLEFHLWESFCVEEPAKMDPRWLYVFYPPSLRF